MFSQIFVAVFSAAKKMEMRTRSRNSRSENEDRMDEASSLSREPTLELSAIAEEPEGEDFFPVRIRYLKNFDNFKDIRRLWL